MGVAMPYIAKLAYHPVVHLAGTGNVVLVDLARAGQTNSATTLDLFLPTSGDKSTKSSTTITTFNAHLKI